MRARLVAALSLATVLLPAVALACPACGRGDGGPGTLYALGVMILFPFGVVAVVLRVIRSTSSSSTEP